MVQYDLSEIAYYSVLSLSLANNVREYTFLWQIWQE